MTTEKIKLALSSRTVWSIFALFIIGGTNGIMGLIPAEFSPYIQTALGFMAVYFKINPSQTYN